MPKTYTTSARSARALPPLSVAFLAALVFLGGCTPVSRHRRSAPVRIVAASTSSVTAPPSGDVRTEILQLARLRDQPGARLRRAFLLLETDRATEALVDLNTVIHGTGSPTHEVEALARALRSEAHLALGDRERADWDRREARKLTTDPLLLDRLGAKATVGIAEASAEVQSLESLGIQPRTAWGAKPSRRRGVEPLGRVRKLTVHHSATAIRSKSRQTSIAAIASIQKYHQKKGWADIGYHYVIDPAGRMWAGRSPHVKGAHAIKANSNNLGICLLGNLMPKAQGAPTPEQTAALDKLLRALCTHHGLTGDAVHTHKGLTGSTVCPGPYLSKQVARFRRRHGGLSTE